MRVCRPPNPTRSWYLSPRPRWLIVNVLAVRSLYFLRLHHLAIRRFAISTAGSSGIKTDTMRPARGGRPPGQRTPQELAPARAPILNHNRAWQLRGSALDMASRVALRYCLLFSCVIHFFFHSLSNAPICLRL
jgi:hypothetical protein